jgi:hypothetical protein
MIFLFDFGEMMRLIATAILATVLFFIFSSSECDAQLLRGLFGRSNTQAKPQLAAPPILVKPAGHIGSYVPQDYSAPTVFPTKAYYENRNPVISRILDGKMTHKYRHPAEVDSRYIGGFHQSHFQNLGIPSGDIGLRGNAYNWRTW